VTRAQARERFYQPDLYLAIAYFYMGQHGAALAHLRQALAQRVPPGADLQLAESVTAQLRKAHNLWRRLTSPFVTGFPLIAQQAMDTCGSTSITMVLRGFGADVPLAESDDIKHRLYDAAGIDQIASLGIQLGAKHGVTFDTAYTDKNRTDDHEVGFPSGHSLEGLRDVLSRGYPVIVSVANYYKPDERYQAWRQGHYLVVVGMKADDEGRIQTVFTLDSDKGKHRRFGATEFDDIWRTWNTGAIVLVPRSPARRFKARISVRSAHDPDVSRIHGVGAASTNA
jgi:uncharacterized protein YvpB